MAGRVYERLVPGLKEILWEGEKAIDVDLSLTQHLKGSLEKVQQEQSECTGHAIVFTGGFKSSVPMLTYFAVFHNLPLYCLYERSDQLRVVVPPPAFQAHLGPFLQGLKVQLAKSKGEKDPLFEALGSAVAWAERPDRPAAGWEEPLSS
jgi:hypothetical protein